MDIINRKDICLELEKETEIPHVVVGLISVERDKDGSARGIELDA